MGALDMIGVGDALRRVDDRVHEGRSPHVESALRTLTILIPVLSNPGRMGIRFVTNPAKLWRTLAELMKLLPGFTLFLGLGWCEEDQMWDIHICVTSDVTDVMTYSLLEWRERIRIRFRQRSIYMRVSEPVRWL